MANFKHVEMLSRGVTVWNAWRDGDPEIKPNLSGTNLMNADLAEANLRQADLRKSDLRKADLTRADLVKADLRNANLRSAKAIGANLQGANMSGAQLVAIDLSKSDLRGADMRGTRFDGADMYEARLGKANLSSANLPRTHLLGADLRKANLRGSNLTDVILVMADLTGADLSLADLTGARLYASEREQWRIDGIRCAYAFWDGAGKQRTPPTRDFKPGEFEMLYCQLPTVEFPFEEGFTPLQAVLMDRVVRLINTQVPGFELNLDSLILRGVPRAVFSVLHREDCPRALELIRRLYAEQSARSGMREVQACIDNLGVPQACANP